MKKRIFFWNYVALILFLTLIMRIGESYGGYSLEFFWTYRQVFHGKGNLLDFILQNLFNIVLFLPFGLFYPGKKYGPIFAFLLSMGIEITQVVLALGYGDLGDVICNMFGATLGVILARRFWKT